MNQLGSIQQRNKAIDRRDVFNSCVTDPDSSSWICEESSLGKRLADSALRVMEKFLKEYQEKLSEKDD